jgi:hypothetical protein
VSRDRRRQGWRRTDERREECTRVAFVLSYDSYLLTTEKTFLLFRRVSLILSLLLARLPLCVSSFIFCCERERASIACLLARAFAASLFLCASLLHPLLDYYYHYHTSRLLLTIIYAFFCFGVGFFAYNTFTHNDERQCTLYYTFLIRY